jgi:hypothetical protein
MPSYRLYTSTAAGRINSVSPDAQCADDAGAIAGAAQERQEFW